MKIRAILLVFIVVCIQASSLYAQNININVNGAPLTSVFKEIQNKTSYTFIYTNELINKAAGVNVNIANQPLSTALDELFSGQPQLNYTLYNNWIVVKDKDTPSTPEKQDIDTLSAQQQTHTVSGVVTDEKGSPLPGATVFITGTTKIAPADKEGKFVFGGLTPGNYTLVVRMIGFDNVIQPFTIGNKTPKFTIKLKESNTLLNEVSISANKRKTPKRDITEFTRNFIGDDENAKECEILNLEVLNFKRSGSLYNLEASSNDFLIIENKALGYRIKYLLKSFIYYRQLEVCYYEGDSYFEELEGTAEQQKKWAENRRAAYLGSSRHYLRSAMNNSSRAQGFFTYRFNEQYTYEPDDSPIRPFNMDSTLKPVNNDFKKLTLVPDKYGKPDLYVYYIWADQTKDVLTWIKQCVDTVTIDKNGGVTPGGNERFNANLGVKNNRGMKPGVAFNFWGRWAFQRVADMTPLDYFAENVPDSTFLKPITTTVDITNNPSFKRLKSILPFDMYHLIGIKETPPSKKQKQSAVIVDSVSLKKEAAGNSKSNLPDEKPQNIPLDKTPLYHPAIPGRF